MKTAQEVRRTTGGYLSATPLLAVPGARTAFNQLLTRVQALPFVPASWTADVTAAMADAGGDSMWQPALAITNEAWRADKTEPLYEDTPSWLASDPQACRAWNMLCDWWHDRMQPILAGWARNQAEVMEAASADAAFWNAVYNVVKPVAVVGEVILAAPEAVGNVVSKSVLGALRGFAPVLIIAGIIGLGYAAYATGAYKKLLPK